jgi:hypothetical protein
VLAGVLWLLGVEVLPNLHLALHDARAHTHAADGTIIVTTFDRDAEPHRHADGTVHSHAATDDGLARDAHTRHHDRRSRPGVLAFDHAPDSHAATGLAHHATALCSAPPPIADALPVDRVEAICRHTRTGRSDVASITTRDARGPPSIV